MRRNSVNSTSILGATQVVNVGGKGVCLSSGMYSPYIGNFYTLEEHLQSFSEDAKFSYLWNSWCIEKIEYIRQLETIQNTYPDYSLHDKNHSAKIIVSIERM